VSKERGGEEGKKQVENWSWRKRKKDDKCGFLFSLSDK
jgi:hypothetical protein